MTFTLKEMEVLDALQKDTFYENGYESVLWTKIAVDTCVAITGMRAQAIEEVLSSLAVKGVLNVSSGREGTIDFNDKAIEYYENRGTVLTGEQKERFTELQAYALKHYNQGGDTFVECWGEKDFARAEAEYSTKITLATLQAMIRTWNRNSQLEEELGSF